METLRQRINALAAGLMVMTAAACSQNSLGDVLGGVLNAPASQMSGTVQGLDTRNETIFLRHNDGSTVAVRYDDRTEVVYQNRTYSVTSLENGDQVTARIIDNGNNNYYTDYIQVNSSVSGDVGNNSGSGSVYNLTGNVRQIDDINGWFTIDTQNSGRVTISLPYNPRSSDVTRFRNLRTGDYVSLQAVYLNTSRYELRQFY